jgi:hypothetical protein
MTATLIFFNKIFANFSIEKLKPLYDSPAQYLGRKKRISAQKKNTAADILT